MPPRSFFDGKRRPNELIFPACRDCNRGSSDLDQIVAFLGRFYTDPKPEFQHEFREYLAVIRQLYPEIYVAFNAIAPVTVGGETFHPFYFNVPHVVRSLELFGAKLGLALHWRELGRVIPPGGGVAVRIFTNADALRGRIPDVVAQIFRKPRTLEQGRFNVAEQFAFQTHSDENSAVTLHFAWFRKSFALLVVAAESRAELFDGEAEDRVSFSTPGCIKGGYPYGLPRMSQFELEWRFQHMKSRMDAIP
jgi:hypothetical protein